MKPFLNILRNIFAPPHCICCDAPLPLTQAVLLCVRCARETPFLEGERCRVCGKSLGTGYQDVTCVSCNARRYAFIQNVSRYAYQGIIRDSILKMKFGVNNLWIARELGLQLAETIEERYAGIDFDFVTYVPLSQLKYLKRRFNQAEEIAIFVAKQLCVPLVETLSKTRNTETQSNLKLKERAHNVKGAFTAVNPDQIAEKTILLIDDVFTTGNTLDACAGHLRKMGAMAVYTATVAASIHM
jgi:ComF family protein